MAMPLEQRSSPRQTIDQPGHDQTTHGIEMKHRQCQEVQLPAQRKNRRERNKSTRHCVRPTYQSHASSGKFTCEAFQNRELFFLLETWWLWWAAVRLLCAPNEMMFQRNRKERWRGLPPNIPRELGMWSENTYLRQELALYKSNC